MEYILTETQLELLVEYGKYPGFAKDEELARKWYKENPHVVNQVMQIGTAFIPIIGPFVSAGIGLADASIYAKEGKKTEAGVAAFFSLLPGIGAVVGKIPGVKQLGQKGMQQLSTKLLSRAPLNTVEQGVISGINLNKQLITQETNSLIKKLASKVVLKVTDKATRKIMIDIAKEGLEMKAEDIATKMMANKTGTTGSGLTLKPASIPGVTT